ncbi:MAG: molybdenum-pterin-binding protein [Dehalococcoidia bacterium]|nr:molybdenum-pterin-binding protein [Dehalococcoidia bacterium]
MRLSARNRLPGVVTSVVIDGLLAQVELKVGDNHVVALISSEACRELDLKEGDPATAVIKSTSVMLIRE